MSSFVIGFILGGTLTAIIGSGFIWGILVIANKKLSTKDETRYKEAKTSAIRANEIAELRLKQQETIATQLEEIAHNMISGFAKVQQT
jgi:esterase/lipase